MELSVLSMKFLKEAVPESLFKIVTFVGRKFLELRGSQVEGPTCSEGFGSRRVMINYRCDVTSREPKGGHTWHRRSFCGGPSCWRRVIKRGVRVIQVIHELLTDRSPYLILVKCKCDRSICKVYCLKVFLQRCLHS